MNKKLILCLATAFTFIHSAGAMEISLEENRGESGSIGFVDIERVFNSYPETQKAKNELQDEIKKREDSVATKKQAVFALKAEINKLKQEREFLSSSRANIPEPVELSSAPVADATAVAVSTEAVVEISSPAAQSIQPQSGGVSGLEPQVKFSTYAVADIDAKILKVQDDLKRREADLKDFQKKAETELLDMETRKTELILGRVYFIMRELAVAESLSVVVDKKNILYGQPAVDLTDKLLEKLRNY